MNINIVNAVCGKVCMETTPALISAGILRATFVIFGLVLGVFVVQKDSKSASQKVFGIALIIVFLIIWLVMAFG